eukprot:GEMP01108110.1.p1 GENE.GEMP01108110.1~~GEMP01108110.1.p1  ORF type:complete len:105 (-),score=5.93 GEMP01108110.1:307-621(-)
MLLFALHAFYVLRSHYIKFVLVALLDGGSGRMGFSQLPLLCAQDLANSPQRELNFGKHARWGGGEGAVEGRGLPPSPFLHSILCDARSPRARRLALLCVENKQN